jgi:tripartite-type tricarboxylate transporter receptor subunit TctC
MNHRHFLSKPIAAVFGVAIGMLAATMAVAQAQYPNRPIKLVVPFVPGGTLDISARLIAKQLNEVLGQPVVVDNRGGAGGMLGVDMVAKSAPDGYTLLLNAATPMVTVVSLQKAPYDVLKDVTAVSQTVTFDYVMAVSAKSGIQNIQELIQIAKKQPGKLNYASAGTGSGQHMFMELARSAAGIQLTHVPYKGNAPAMQALLAGEVDLIFDTSLGILSQASSNRLKPLLTSSLKPLIELPGVPTMESLYPGSSIQGWHGIFAPAGTPKETVNLLAEAIRKAVNSPELSAKFKEMGLEPSGLSSERFTEIVRRDYERWGKLIRDNQIKAD